MKNQKFFGFLLACAATALAFACDDLDVKEEEQAVANDVEFVVSAGAIQETTADIVVRHNGKVSDTWFGFFSTDLEAKAEDLIKSHLSSVTKKTLHVGTSQTVALKDLVDKSTYRYIAFGVNADKEMYGTPGELVFSTNTDYSKAVFSVKAFNITTNSADVSISHAGYDDFTYFGFVTSDKDTDIETLIAGVLPTIKDNKGNVKADTLMTGLSNKVSLSKLNDNTLYRYIVFGIDATGFTYGTPGVVSFQTELDLTKIQFNIEPVSVKKETATLKITHNGTENITWYGFNTTDVTTALATLITNTLKTVKDSDLRIGTSKEAYLSGLAPVTNYRYVVTGVNSDGTAYGIPAELKFTSADEDYDEVVFRAREQDVTYTSANVKVSHNGGKDKFKWYGFITEDLTSEVSALIPAANDIPEADVKQGQELLVPVTGLLPGKEYRYIVTGYRVDDSGTKYVYGVPADRSFSTNDVKFTAAVSGAPGAKEATISVSHNGLEDMTWYGFATEDLTTPAADLAAAKAPAAADLKTGKAGTDVLTGLKDETKYRYIVCGFSAEGKAWGTPGTVEFTTDAFYKEDPNWTVSYTPGTTDYPGYPEQITNTVADPTLSGKYFITYFTKDEYGSYPSVQAFVKNYAAQYCKEEIEYYVAYYTSQGNSSTFDDFLYSGTDSEYYKEFSYNEYWAMAIGFTSDGEPTGHFAYKEFKVEPTEEEKALYNQWLGTWSLPRGDKNDVIIISKKQDYVSYYIDGIAGLDFSIPAEFQKSGGFTFKAQELGTWQDPDYGLCTDKLMGTITYTDGKTYVVDGNYVIATVTMNSAGQGVWTPGSVSLSVGGTFDITGFQILYETQSGSLYGYVSNSEPFNTLPATMSKAESNPNYAKWLGSWNVARGTETDTWVIAEDKNNLSYKIIGIDGMDAARVFQGKFNYSTNALELYAQENVYTYIDSEGTWTDKLLGVISRNDSNIRVTGSYMMTSAALDASGNSAALSSGQVTLSDNIQYDVIGIKVFATQEGSSSAGTYSEGMTAIPGTMTKASGTSLSKAKAHAMQETLKRVSFHTALEGLNASPERSLEALHNPFDRYIK